MSNHVLVKRSNVPGKVPTLAQLTAGELGINTNDAKLFFGTGTEVVEVAKVGDLRQGTVTSVAVVTANGLAGTVETANTAPVITLSTTVNGLLKGDGTSISAAVKGIDYVQAGVGSGVPLQMITTNVAAQSGTTGKVDSNTIPLFTDGAPIWSQVIIPKMATSNFVIDGSFYIDHDTNNRRIVVAVWRTIGAVNTLVGVSAAFVTASGNGGEIAISFNDYPNTLSSITYSLRCWSGYASGTAGTWHIGQGATPVFNGTLSRQMLRLTEAA